MTFFPDTNNITYSAWDVSCYHMSQPTASSMRSPNTWILVLIQEPFSTNDFASWLSSLKVVARISSFLISIISWSAKPTSVNLTLSNETAKDYNSLCHPTILLLNTETLEPKGRGCVYAHYTRTHFQFLVTFVLVCVWLTEAPRGYAIQLLLDINTVPSEPEVDVQYKCSRETNASIRPGHESLSELDEQVSSQVQWAPL